jgi:hypothetical protein
LKSGLSSRNAVIIVEIATNKVSIVMYGNYGVAPTQYDLEHDNCVAEPIKVWNYAVCYNKVRED